MASPEPRPTFSFFGLLSSLRATHPPSSTAASSHLRPAASATSGTSAMTISAAAAAAAAAASASASAQAQDSATETSAGSTTAAATTATPQPTAAAATSIARSATASIAIPMQRRRDSQGSDGSMGGLVEKGEPMYIGGRLPSGEVKFYKLGLRPARYSDLSLDRLSL